MGTASTIFNDNDEENDMTKDGDGDGDGEDKDAEMDDDHTDDLGVCRSAADFTSIQSHSFNSIQFNLKWGWGWWCIIMIYEDERKDIIQFRHS